MTELLQIDDLAIRFRSYGHDINVLNGVSYSVGWKESVGLVGESGSGKSVTNLAVMGLLPTAVIDRGRMRFDGQDILAMGPARRRRLRGRQIGMIFQDPMNSLNPVLKIGRQIEEGIILHFRVSRSEARRRAADILARCELSDTDVLLNKYPHELSGGMLQRVMIAAALVLEPKLLIADEPTTALDVTVQAQMLDLMSSRVREAGASMVLISHDLGVVASVTDRVNVMYAGSIVESGPSIEVFLRPMHPYTVGLVHSIPSLSEDRGVVPIDGSPPDLAALPPGCPFAPRCRWRLPVCDRIKPAMEPIHRSGAAGSRAIACHNPVSDREAASGTPEPRAVSAGVTQADRMAGL
ncbi:MAG: ABC transporter ATP-binding protein [Bauldia sp.]|uniref:ABC transporter ATP-binding protein n=1 Tax=Bauldia sp. TaxID=2575872 RepID=UPI001D85F219|nr:ABC transporter ATP-binding protein [Bauldia sp.]MCB1497581.1 ABC transporter ATP-binding protein [Bauldia sp.]